MNETIAAAASLHKDLRFTKRLIAGITGLILFAGGIIFSIATGSVDIRLSDILKVFSGDETGSNYNIIWNIRLPRIITGALVGINLALSGVILQCILRNPLADPGIIGITAGAGLAAVTVMILFPEQSYLVPLVAFLGAIGASILVYGLSWKGGINPMRLILAGVAVSAFFGAAMSAIMVFHSDKVQGILNWMVGGFQGRSWGHVKMIIPYTLVGAVAALFSFKYLNILMLGDEASKGLGVRVEAVRMGLLALSAFLAASAVSAAGLLGFVGLIVPHAVRLVVGSDHKFLLPLSLLFGASLVVIADTGARTIFSPVEIPVGVIMGFLGAPFFLYLLRRGLKR